MKYKLEEIADIYDSLHQTPSYIENGISMVRVTDLSEGYLNLNKTLKVSEEIYNEFTKKYVPKNNDIIMSRVGTYGVCVLVNTEEKFCLGQNTVIISPKQNKRFLYYYLMSSNVKEQIEGFVTGSTQKTISLKNIKNIIIDLPSDEQQERIANVLDNITQKIELNNQINDNLSEQLQLIYDEWFGKYEINNLPDGWKVEKLKNIATFSQGVQVPIDKQINEEESGYTRFIRIVDITQKNDKDIRFIEDTERGKVEENEIFMIRYGTPGILSWNYKGIIANNLFKITPKVNYLSSNFLYSYFNNNKFQRYIKGNATSSTMPAINFSTLNDRDIIIPTTDLIDKFNKISETIRLKQLSISNQNRVLSDLRDTLLPKLMNGEIDLDKIEI